ncbi:MAG: ROK family protein [Actinomycetota bacterium]|nr:ROK family protein [Actinomycetota bacterium]
MADGNYVIGVDIGGTKTAIGLIDTVRTFPGGRRGVLCELVEPTPKFNDLGPAAAAKSISDFIKKLIAKINQVGEIAIEQVKGIGIGVAGTIDFDGGIIVFSPNLPFRNFPLKEAIAETHGLPILIDNDANAAAWGEKVFGAGRGSSEIICVTLGTGVGGGLILNGEMYRGSLGCAAEVGHMIIDRNGPMCACGNYGCFEALAAGPAISKRARAALTDKPNSPILKFASGELEKVNAEHLALAAAAGDALAIQILTEIGEIVGTALTNLTNIFNPEVIVVGGGVADTGELILRVAEGVVKERAIKPSSEMVKILKAHLGNRAGFMGAGALIEKELKESLG